MARYWCSGVAARLIGETFPWGTIIVNIVGSFIIGFFATLTGPGRVWLQSLPLSRLAGRIYKAIPGIGGSRREEGSILGGIGDLLDGDS